MTTRALRWGDNDRYFGPFTYSRDRGYRSFAVTLGTGYHEDSRCRLRVTLGTHTLIWALPPIVKPAREWVDTSHYGWSNGPGSGYFDEIRREYGIRVSEGHLSVSYGRQTDASDTEQRWSYFLPWTQWRHVRHSLYDLQGALFADMPQRRKGLRLGDPGFSNHWEAGRALEEACPSATFAFTDYDGEALTARTRIEEREWLFGERWCAWLSLFRKPKVRRSLDIRFSGETGKRKGSWKGGTVGHGIDLLPGELHEAAFRRYCAEHQMGFVGPVAPEHSDAGSQDGQGPVRAETPAKQSGMKEK